MTSTVGEKQATTMKLIITLVSTTLAKRTEVAHLAKKSLMIKAQRQLDITKSSTRTNTKKIIPFTIRLTKKDFSIDMEILRPRKQQMKEPPRKEPITIVDLRKFNKEQKVKVIKEDSQEKMRVIGVQKGLTSSSKITKTSLKKVGRVLVQRKVMQKGTNQTLFETYDLLFENNFLQLCYFIPIYLIY